MKTIKCPHCGGECVEIIRGKDVTRNGDLNVKFTCKCHECDKYFNLTLDEKEFDELFKHTMNNVLSRLMGSIFSINEPNEKNIPEEVIEESKSTKKDTKEVEEKLVDDKFGKYLVDLLDEIDDVIEFTDKNHDLAGFGKAMHDKILVNSIRDEYNRLKK